MISEKSCGAVVFTELNNEIKYLVIKSLTGIYGFPKGHTEVNETEEQTVLREVLEEVGVKIKLIPGFRIEDEYIIHRKENIVKRVVYFIGEYYEQEFTFQKEELTTALLVNYETAMGLFQFDNSKKILTAANNFLLNRKSWMCG